MDEEILVHNSQKGDLDAFEQLVIKYQDRIYTLALRYLGNEEDAWDAAQEVFIKAYKSLHTFKGTSSFSTWIFKVCANICIDELRRRKRRIKAVSFDDSFSNPQGENLENIISDQGHSVFEIFEKKQKMQFVYSLLDDMKSEQKHALFLRVMMEYTYAEIAEIQKCSIGTVKSRLNRARYLFREKLDGLESQLQE